MSKKLFKLNDNAIFMIREGLQLCLLTNTNFVDILRGMAFQSTDDSGTLTTADEYVEQWNEMVQRMNEAAEARLAELEGTEQAEAEVN